MFMNSSCQKWKRASFWHPLIYSMVYVLQPQEIKILDTHLQLPYDYVSSIFHFGPMSIETS